MTPEQEYREALIRISTLIPLLEDTLHDMEHNPLVKLSYAIVAKMGLAIPDSIYSLGCKSNDQV